jgi:hypothetical protein
MEKCTYADLRIKTGIQTSMVIIPAGLFYMAASPAGFM